MRGQWHGRRLFRARLRARLACAFAGLFDDNEARRRIELLRQQVEASQKASKIALPSSRP